MDVACNGNDWEILTGSVTGTVPFGESGVSAGSISTSGTFASFADFF